MSNSVNQVITSSVLWQKASATLRDKDRDVIPVDFVIRPEDLIIEIEKRITESKGRPIKLPNGETFFVRDLLQKISRWIKRFAEVGDVAVQYDPGHAALPWALVRLILQLSMNNLEKHAEVLEGVEQISYYLVWSKIEESCLAVPFEAHDRLVTEFIDLYAAILTFTARSIRFLHSKRPIIDSFLSTGSKFRADLEKMANKKVSIESYAVQISSQLNYKQYTEVVEIRNQLGALEKPVIRIELGVHSVLAASNRAEHQQILDWASTIPFERHYRLTRDKALSGTGQWLFVDSQFSAWMNSSRSQMLWLHGRSGSGKSTLISTVIQSLIDQHEQQQAPYPLYFYCSRNDAEPERANPEEILRSLMRQASDLPQGPPLHPTLHNRFNKRRVAGDIGADEATEILIETIRDRPLTYIMIDALDECDRQRREILIDALKMILAKAESLVKIFVTSRDNHHDIVWSMKGFPAICIDASGNEADLHRYVHHSVQSAVKMRKLLPTEKVTEDLQQLIERSLCDQAAGMFRWVELQMKFLCTLRKRSILLQRLDRMPPGLEATYKDLYQHSMTELGNDQADVVRKILSWLLIARRPIHTFELCQLVCVPDEPDMSNETVLDMCFDLIIHDEEQDLFRFSHLSVREFLENRLDEYAPVTLHSMSTRDCLSLLTSGEYAIEPTAYAPFYWLFHAEEATKHGGGAMVWEQLNHFFMTERDSFMKWNDCLLRAQVDFQSDDAFTVKNRLAKVLVHSASAFLVASCFGLPTCIEHILTRSESPIDLEQKNYHGETALYLSSEHGHIGNVHVLLNNGANVNAQGGSESNALQVASKQGHTQIVEVLVDHGADVNAIGKYDSCALSAASSAGHQDIVEYLISKGAQADNSGLALRDASRKGSLGIVRLLLNHGADPNMRYSIFGYALLAAVQEGHVQVAELLLHKGADINARNPVIDVPRGFKDRPVGPPSDALHMASSKGNEDMVAMLLDNGADVNAKSGEYNNALQSASRHGHEGVVKLLLQKGADVNAEGGTHGYSLIAAAIHGHRGIVELLLENGADINAQGGRFGDAFYIISKGSSSMSMPRLGPSPGFDDDTLTALSSAAFTGRKEMVQLLLSKGADIRPRDPTDANALYAAAFNNSHEIMETLVHEMVKRGVEAADFDHALYCAVNERDTDVLKLLQRTVADMDWSKEQLTAALVTTAVNCDEEEMILLLDRGADIDAQWSHYGTALHAASSRGYTSLVSLLLARGADVHARDGGDSTVLYAAIRGGNVEIVRMLLQHGADVKTISDRHESALEAALSEQGGDAIVRLLLDNETDINTLGGEYVSALQAVSWRGHVEFVERLLSCGANVNAQGGIYGTALQAASYQGHKEIAELLLRAGADVNAAGEDYGNALQAASRRGSYALVKILLEAGADVNAVGGPFGHALQAASYYGSFEIVKLLIERGANVNASGAGYGCALGAAASSFGGDRSTKTVELLLQHGANVDIQDSEHRSVLDAAFSHQSVEVVGMLLSRGAKFDPQSKKLGRVLEAACVQGRSDIVRMLLESSVKVKTGESFGNALKAASSRGHVEVVELLLFHGVDINEKTSQYGSALEAATEAGRIETVRLLLERGAGVSEEGSGYNHALRTASSKGYVDILRLLHEYRK